uniref:Uncharacterized protein n=1 Tax=Physcomitrium patens TaxID=3218 RepID=A0A2K1KJZ5_PHYPA|nr:hypothetical protein PHYPA_007777 [Physcomitrium patens]
MVPQLPRWELCGGALSFCHQAQFKAVKAMNRLDISAACKPTTSFHSDSTAQLELALQRSAWFFFKNNSALFRLSI